jgi:hypothetical protein
MQNQTANKRLWKNPDAEASNRATDDKEQKCRVK